MLDIKIKINVRNSKILKKEVAKQALKRATLITKSHLT